MFLKGYGKQRLTQKYGADLAMQQQSKVGAGCGCDSEAVQIGAVTEDWIYHAMQQQRKVLGGPCPRNP
jgi:hypothetical protein